MSTTAYLANVTGAAAFGGTAAHSVFASSPAVLGDATETDRLVVEHTGSLLNDTSELIELRGRLRADGVTIHEVQFGGISPDDDPRDVMFRWVVTLTASDTARVLCESSISGAGSVGPDYKSPRSKITRDQPFSVPVTFDVTIQLDEATAVYTPDASFIHKVEPTLSVGAPTDNIVISVNDLDGAVVLGPGQLVPPALPYEFAGMPVVSYNGSGPNAGKYNPRPAAYLYCVYVGPSEPTVANCLAPSFATGIDFWIRTT